MPSDLAIRIRPGLLPAKQLHDKSIAVKQGSVALLGRRSTHGERGFRRAPKRFKFTARNPSNQSTSRLGLLAFLNEGQERCTGMIIEDRIVQKPGPLT